MRHIFCVALGVTALAGTACDFDTDLAPEVELRIVVDSQGLVPATNDFGYQIELERCRAAIHDVEFTTAGEKHADASLWQRLHDVVVPTAYAHPGHYAGGEIVGELAGDYVFEWHTDGAELGLATMLEAKYNGANFSFGRAKPSSRVPIDDPIIGHTFDLAGEATIDGVTYTFEALVDEDEDRRVVGLPLALDVGESTDVALGLSFALVDPYEGDTVFDGIDFAALDDDGDMHVVIEPGTEAYNHLTRNLQVHDQYLITTR